MLNKSGDFKVIHLHPLERCSVCLFSGRTYGRTPRVKIMTTYSAGGPVGQKKNSYFLCQEVMSSCISVFYMEKSTFLHKRSHDDLTLNLFSHYALCYLVSVISGPTYEHSYATTMFQLLCLWSHLILHAKALKSFAISLPMLLKGRITRAQWRN